MSNFVNDTLQRQIQRGEVFFGMYAVEAQPVGTANFKEFILTGGATDTRFNFGIVTSVNTVVLMYDNSTTAADGTELLMNNLYFGHSNTTTATVHRDPTTAAGGTIKLLGRAPEGDFGSITPFNSETGMILNAGEKYLITIANDSGSPAPYLFSWFTQEL